MQDEPTTPPVGFDGHCIHLSPWAQPLDPRLHLLHTQQPSAFESDRIENASEEVFPHQRNLAFEPGTHDIDFVNATTTTAGSTSTSNISPTTTSTDFFFAPSCTFPLPPSTSISPEKSLALFQDQVEEFFRLEDATAAPAPGVGNGIGVGMGNSPTKSPYASADVTDRLRNDGFGAALSDEGVIVFEEEGVFDLDLRMDEGW
jgi:hypothetical protein